MGAGAGSQIHTERAWAREGEAELEPVATPTAPLLERVTPDGVMMQARLFQAKRRPGASPGPRALALEAIGCPK